MRRFIKRFLLFIGFPLSIILCFYVVTDPFKVVKSYANYYPDDGIAMAPLNEGYVSVSTYDRYHITYNYDSFVLGNSRSRVYHIDEWQKYLPEGSSGFHFYALSESLYGLCLKIKYLDEQGSDIRNVLLIVDENLLKKDVNLKGQLFQVPPQLENNKNFTAFHFDAFRAFCDWDFLKSWIVFKFNGKVTGCLYYDKGYILKYNEGNLVDNEQLLKDGAFYTENLISAFNNASQNPNVPTAPVLRERHVAMLEDINKIFAKHNCNYRIVISPQWDKRPINTEDVLILTRIFGKENVFDFSGVNEFTTDFHNFYEPNHYRPTVAYKIMEMVYEK